MINKKENKGITLIALVITIIVVLILASITIGRLKVKDTIKESQSAKTSAEILGEKQILNIAVEAAMEKHKFGEVEESQFKKSLDKHIGQGKYALDATTIEDKFIVKFTKSFREYLVDKYGDINNYFGVINIDIISQTSKSVTISVNADSKNGMPDEPKYNYYIKKTSEKQYPDSPQPTVSGSEYTFTDLEQDTSYTIKVTTTDKEGNELIGEKEVTTEKIPGGTIDGYITFGTPQWKNGTASITISTNTSYTIQYQINDIDGAWISIESGDTVNNLFNKDTVYARLTDGKNYGEYASVTILDLIKPTVTVTASGLTTRSITANVTAIDNESGMPTTPIYEYYIKKSSESTYPSVATYAGSNSSYTFDELTQSTSYNIKVITIDNAGNIGEGTTLDITTGTVPSGLQSGVITFGTPQWSGGKASVTISTTKTDYTIEYQINSINGTWTSIESGGTVGNLNHDDTVYARLTDGKNHGDYASVTILDGISPIISSFGVTAYDTTTISVQTTAVDNETGIESYKYEYKKSSETTYTTAATTSSSTYRYTNLADGTEYNLRVTVTDKAGNQATSNATQTTQTANSGPVLASVTLNSKTTSSITIAARATDADGDNLTYMLYTGTSSSSLSLAGISSSIAQGTQTTLSKSSLSSYTDYYYRIDVTDGKATTQGSVNSVRTYCPGGSTTTVSCGTCGGDGKVSNSVTCTCSGKAASTTAKQSCPDCGASVTVTRLVCTGNSQMTIGSRWSCSCGRSFSSNPGTHAYTSGTKSCSSCGGEGSSTSTTYCSHNKIGQHDN